MARHVRRRRDRLGWTQEELAAVSGVSVRQIKNIEASRSSATLDTLEALAGALGVEPNVLLWKPRGGG